MPRQVYASNLVGINTLEGNGATTAHLFTAGTNLGIGAGCLLTGTSTAPNNTAFGHQALAGLPNTSGGFNTAVGYTALQAATAASTRCTAVGYQALKVATDRDNTAVGANAGKAITTGIGNTFVGSGAGALTTTQNGNTAVGWDAAAQGTTAGSTTSVGYRAGYTSTTGQNNTFLGYAADTLANNTSGATAVGQAASAGVNAVACGRSAAANGIEAVALGQTTVASASYATAVGSKASATGQGSVAIGCDSTDNGASTAVVNEFKLGTVNHLYNLPGKVGATLTFGEGINIAAGTATGTKFGTAATQKLGWWNATPVVQSTGWSVTAGYTATKTFNPEATTLTEVARVLGTLNDTLKAYGMLA